MSYFLPAAGVPKLPGAEAVFQPSDAALLICAGQSNSAGTDLLTPGEYITTPLANVYALGTADQQFGQTTPGWVGYTSNNCQIGSSANVHAVTTPYYIATEWQRRITAGQRLPNLYIIHVAGTAQGIHQSTGGRWWPGRSDSLTDSYYHLTRHLASIAVKGLRASGNTVRVLGVDWNQWESECSTDASADGATGSFNSIIDGFAEALGCDMPFTFWRPRSRLYDESRFQKVRKQIDALVQSDQSRFSCLDPGTHPNFVESSVSASTQGIFKGDGVHYKREIYPWAAAWYISKWLSGNNRGVPARGKTGTSTTIRQARDVVTVDTVAATVTSSVATGVASSLRSRNAPIILSGGAFIDQLYPPIPTPVYLASPYKRLSTYTGNVMQLKRTSDSATANVGLAVYNSANLAAISAFVGGSTAQVFMTDHISGSVQTALSSAGPALDLSGAKGRVSAYFNITPVSTPSLSLGTQHTSLITAAGTHGLGTVLAGNSAANYIGYFPNLAPDGTFSVVVNGFNYSIPNLNAVAPSGATSSFIIRRNGTNTEVFVNGTSLGNVTVAGSGASAFTVTGMGGFPGGAYPQIGHITEAIHWNVWLNNDQVQALADSARLLV